MGNSHTISTIGIVFAARIYAGDIYFSITSMKFTSSTIKMSLLLETRLKAPPNEWLFVPMLAHIGDIEKISQRWRCVNICQLFSHFPFTRFVEYWLVHIGDISPMCANI